MATQASKAWTTDQLIQMSNALGNGYLPSLKAAGMATGDRWTVQRHIQASAMRARAYL
ncbi:hypothetical protein IQ254_19385 [Nodosilinea sp. LEGE 07088]|uniref:hypothetical protein n=1 Tax=Nodosilinea sp. LEGE 07088 TaxID=2777968 RepID=UPI00188297E4|nr:hypothetical protein [Nodosilinea sp. LEGE 07088]MBE9139334.1 hypothetical protein [Nodosilinea sp. LEGE 07088]